MPAFPSPLSTTSQTMSSGHRWFLLGLRLLLGGVFVFASIDKIARPQAFAETIFNYQILPDILVNVSALILPWLELLAGLALILNIRPRAAAGWLNLLLVVFIAALSYNLSRDMNVECGCFHAGTAVTDRSYMIETILRDIALLAAGLWLWFALAPPRTPESPPVPDKEPAGNGESGREAT